VTDAKGRRVDFRNTVIIMTSNVGASDMNKEVELGFHTATPGEEKHLEAEHAKVKAKVLEDLKKQFRPEFLNRLDATIVFKSLSQLDIKKILVLQLADLQKRLDEQELKLRVTASARSLLMERGYDMKQGARPMRRTIQDLLEDPLATGLLDGRFQPGDTITATRRGDLIAMAAVRGPQPGTPADETETPTEATPTE
jgi:ATP-dependent Clp protease ATP-binding subunit ClpC